MNKWLYYKTLDIVWKTSKSSTRLSLILNPSSKAGFRISVIIIPSREKITEKEEGWKLVLIEKISLFSSKVFQIT